MPSALTRIKNNQITDSTILANVKIVPGSIVGSLFNSNLTMTSDVTITGNLTVQGASTYLTVASTNTYVNDPLIVLNNAFSGTNTYDLGFVFNRGTLQNVALIWNEFNKEFRLVGTTETGTTYGNINQSNFANLRLGNLTVDYAITTTGNFFTNGFINTTANISAAVGVFGAINSTGLINTTGNLSASQVSVATLNATGLINTLGNISASEGSFATVKATGLINTTGNVSASTINAATINTSGNILANIFTGGRLITTTAGTTADGTGQIFLNGTTSNRIDWAAVGTGAPAFTTRSDGTKLVLYPSLSGSVTDYALGIDTATLWTSVPEATAGFNFKWYGATTLAANLSGAGNFTTTKDIVINGTTPASSSATGALIVKGGAGIAGNLYAGAGIQATTIGNVTAAEAYFTNVAITGNVIGGLAQFAAINSTPIGNATPSTGVFTTATAGDVSSGFIGNTGTAFTGASINLSGNVLASAIIGASLNVSGNVTATELNIGTIKATGLINTLGNISASEGSFATINATGLINTAGNISTTQLNAGQINTTGNILATGGVFNALTVNGTVGVTTLNATTLTATGNIIAGLAQFAAINSTPIGNTTAAAGSFTVLNAANSVWANASIATTAQGIGAVVVPNGGISVAGAANVAGALTIGGATQLNSTLGVGGITTFTNSTNATAITNGAVIIQGGASVLKDLYVGGNLYAANIVGVSANVITVEDPLLFLKPSYTFPYNYDIGVYSAFTGTGLTTAGNVLQHTAIVRHQETNTWTFASNLAEPGAGHVVFDNNTVYDPIKAGNLELATNIASTSTSTGALIVAGGAGIAGTLVAGQINSTGNVLGQVGTFNALTINGNESITGYLNVTGNIIGAAGTLSNLTVNGNESITGYLNVTGNILGAAGTFNELTVNGNESVTGYLNVTGNVLASSLSTGQINTTGNVLATTGIFNALTVNGNESVTGYLNVTGNILGASGILSGLTVNGTTTTQALNSTGNVLATGGIFNALTVNGNESVTGYLNVTGNIIGAAGTLSGLTVNGNESITGYLNVTGNIIGAAGTLSGLTVNGNESVTGYLNVTGNIIGAVGTLSGLTVNGVTSITGNVIGGLAQFAAINSTPIGNASTSTGRFTTLSASASFYANATTPSTAFNNGAIVTQGGIGAAGNISIKSQSQLTVGADIAKVSLDPNQVALLTSNVAGYSSLSIQNISSNSYVSTDFIAYADNSTGGEAFINLGITGQNYNQPQFSVFKPNDGYLLVQGNATTTGGNLVIGTSQLSNDILFFTGGTTTDRIVAKFSDIEYNFQILSNTSSTNSSTGALVVTGGAGFGSNIWVANGAVINSAQTSDNFIIRTTSSTVGLLYNTAQQTLTVNSGAFANNATPVLGATLAVRATDSMLIPVGSTAQRPSNTGNIDLQGMLRYNTSINNLEWYDGGQWAVPGSAQTTVITDQSFTGNGVQTTFILSNASSTNSCIVSINGVLQIPVTSYAITGNTLVFTEAPDANDAINVRKLTTNQSINSLASANGYMVFDVSEGSGTYANITGGFAAATVRQSINAEGILSLVNDTKIAARGTNVNIVANATPYVLDTFTQTRYTSAKYVVSAKKGATNMEAYEALLVTDQAGNAYITTYGVVNNGTTMGVLSANVLAGNVQLYFTTNTGMTNANVRVYTTYIE